MWAYRLVRAETAVRVGERRVGEWYPVRREEGPSDWLAKHGVIITLYWRVRLVPVPAIRRRRR
jgi:hypothetical protein